MSHILDLKGKLVLPKIYFKCVVCREIPTNPVAVCHDGHMLCQSEAEYLLHCPGKSVHVKGEACGKEIVFQELKWLDVMIGNSKKKIPPGEKPHALEMIDSNVPEVAVTAGSSSGAATAFSADVLGPSTSKGRHNCGSTAKYDCACLKIMRCLMDVTLQKELEQMEEETANVPGAGTLVPQQRILKGKLDPDKWISMTGANYKALFGSNGPEPTKEMKHLKRKISKPKKSSKRFN